MSTLMRRLRRVRPWWHRFKQNGYKRDHCHHCGHPFRWSRDARHATGNRDGLVYHGPCQAYLAWRGRADERLIVLGLACELAGLTARDVTGAAELRASSEDERVAVSNRAF